MLSSWATSSIEEVAEAAPGGLRWLQLYVYKDRAVAESLVRRAERAGYKGIFVTVDTPYLGRRIADVRNKFQLPSHLRYLRCHPWDYAGAAGAEVCPGHDFCGVVPRAAIWFGSQLSFPCAGQREAAGCWRKRRGAFLYAHGNVFLALFKPQLGIGQSDLLWCWAGIQQQKWLGSERGLDFVGQNSPPKDVMVSSVLSYDTVLSPGPYCYWLQSPFLSNFNPSFTQIQKHVGISLSKFSMRAIFTPRCVLGHFLCLRISDIMIDFSTSSSCSPLQSQWGLQL